MQRPPQARAVSSLHPELVLFRPLERAKAPRAPKEWAVGPDPSNGGPSVTAGGSIREADLLDRAEPNVTGRGGGRQSAQPPNSEGRACLL